MKKTKILNIAKVVLLVAVILMLIAGTIVEKYHGNAFALEHFYGSPWFIGVLALAAAAAVAEIVVHKLWHNIAKLLVCTSVVVILAGGLCTYLFGQHGRMELVPNQPCSTFAVDGVPRQLPFSVTLEKFEIVHYPGTKSPMDFVSHVAVTEQNNAEVHQYDISMNNILKKSGFRFYQENYDEQGHSFLSVSHDPVGIAVSYTGYLLLLVGIILLMVKRGGQFRTLLKGMKGKVAAVAVIMLLSGQYTSAQRVLPQPIAEKMGEMYVLYKGRICPLQTLSKDFTTKLCGKATHKGFSSEQVLSGWMFYFDDWKDEPIFKIKGGETQRLLGIDGRWAALSDFTDSVGEHPVANALKELSPTAPAAKNLRAAEEKYNLISMLYNGQLLKIFPLTDEKGTLAWYSQNDQLPENINDTAEYLFIRKYMSYSQELVAFGDFESLGTLFEKTRKFQEKEAGDVLPSKVQTTAERLYNRLSTGRWLPMASITLGLLLFAYALFLLARGRGLHKGVKVATFLWTLLLTLFLIAIFVLKWIAGGHLPMAGGFDSMNLLAIAIGIVALCCCRKYEMSLPIGMMAMGFALLVAMIGGSNPPITNLMPVLVSPLLSLHVSVIMLAYALFFFVMLNGVGALLLGLGRQGNAAENRERMRKISLLMLYPAEFFLALGICIGAVWANVSWGNYWAWNPKEVWALITLIVYAVPLQSGFKLLQKPKAFHIYCIVAFLCVFVTYFGVNLILGGVHAYN